MSGQGEETNFNRSNDAGVLIEDFLMAFPGSTSIYLDGGVARSGLIRTFMEITIPEMGKVVVALHTTHDSLIGYEIYEYYV